MSLIADMKVFILRALARMNEIPMPGEQLFQSVKNVFEPKPLDSEIKTALKELEADGFISGVRDDFDAAKFTWTLTEKGTHKARKLN